MSATIAALQYAALLVLGYYFAGAYVLVENSFTKAGLLVSAVVVVGVLYYVLTNAVRKQFWNREPKA